MIPGPRISGRRPGSIGARPGAVLALLFGILFTGVADNQVILPVLPAIAESFGHPVTRVTWAVTLYAFAAAVLNLFSAPLSDRFGRKPLLMLGLLGFAVASTGLANAASLPAFFVLRAAAGLFAGVLSTCVMAYVGDYFPYSTRGRAMGTVMASYFVALVFGVPLGAWVADHWGWRRIFLLTSVLAVLLSAAVAWILPDLHEPKPVIGKGADRASQAVDAAGRYRSYLGSSPMLAMLLSGACVSGATLALLTFISPWLLGRFEMSTSELGLVFMLIGGASALASPLSGWVADHLGKRRTFIASTLVSALLLFGLPFAAGVRTMGVALFCIALAMALRQTSQQTLATEMVSADGRGAFVALRNAFSQIGIGLSVLIATPLFGRFGFAGIAVFCAALSVIAAGCYYWVREPPGARS